MDDLNLKHPKNCPFCAYTPEAIILQTENAIALFDGFPVSEGHALVVPRHHVSSLFDLDAAKRAELWQLVFELRNILAGRFHPDGFNVGLNDGAAAGQTVPHAHIHIIPRYSGDVPDPRGGVRWVVPNRANYWTEPRS